MRPRSIAVQETQSDKTPNTWVWTHAYIAYSNKKRSKKKTDNPQPQKLIIALRGDLVLPVSRQTLKAVLVDGRNEPTVTWEITSDHLTALMQQAVDELRAIRSTPQNDEVNTIPELNDCDYLPYRDEHETAQFVADGPSSRVKKLRATDKVDCKICPEKDIRIDKMRKHVGAHILCSFRKVIDMEPLRVEIGQDPCGWCGLEGCWTRLSTKKRGGIQISSNCPYHHAKLVYNDARQFIPREPCTNVPVRCPLCPADGTGERPTVWKYNAMGHIEAFHADPADERGLPDIPEDFRVEIFVSKVEEKALGIPEEKTVEFREEYEVQNSSDIEDVKEYLRDDNLKR
ncbi:hypothetical protein H0H93_009164, partial [Arthromyces matolae]